MGSIMQHVTEILLALEIGLAVVVVLLDVKEIRFLSGLRPFLPIGEELPLFEALSKGAIFLTFIGFWLLGLTVLGALGISLTDDFPILRAINGALLLMVISGPYYVGRALRKYRKI